MTIEGGHLIWSEVEEKLNELNNKIFEGIDKTALSDYEKRKIIFEYLCNNLEYDFDALTDMILNSKKLKFNSSSFFTINYYISKSWYTY